jgi:hypothetical protein
MYAYVYFRITVNCALSPQDYVFFILPPPHYRGTPFSFSPSIYECWYGRVNLIFKMRVCTDGGRLKQCQCALIETLYDYCPSSHAKPWWPSTAQVGTKLLYLPMPDPVLYVMPLSHILGNCPWFQPETTAPFPSICTAARMRAIRWACATVRAPLTRGAPCSTSIPGP